MNAQCYLTFIDHLDMQLVMPTTWFFSTVDLHDVDKINVKLTLPTLDADD